MRFAGHTRGGLIPGSLHTQLRLIDVIQVLSKRGGVACETTMACRLVVGEGNPVHSHVGAMQPLFPAKLVPELSVSCFAPASKSNGIWIAAVVGSSACSQGGLRQVVALTGAWTNSRAFGPSQLQLSDSPACPSLALDLYCISDKVTPTERPCQPEFVISRSMHIVRIPDKE